MRNAISNDGSRVVWATVGGTPHLYLRDMAKEETVRLDVVQPGAVGGGDETVVFDTASADGSRVFFTDKSRLTVGATEVTGPTAQHEEGNLYECHIVESAGKLSCVLTNITNAGVQGEVLGVSQDSSYVYLVSNSVLAAGASLGECERFLATEPTCNLYVAHRTGTAWSLTYAATLSSDDAPDWANETFGVNFSKMTSRVSANGRYVAFMSDRKLTGYDNRDIGSGALDEEVFVYDAESGKISCVSCNPTGARPRGIFERSEFDDSPLIVDPTFTWQQRWMAGNLPSWNPISRSSTLYQPRYLFDSGRVFFDSSDALLPQDTNGLEDVYEYEPAGVGSCARAGGCVDLLSSGTASEESAFLDASASGDDAFIMTTGRLASQDLDSAFDVYDAHVCTVNLPCGEGAVSSPPCDSSDSCKAAPTPQPALFGQPSSETFSGSGNVVQVVGGKPAVKSGGLTRAQKLARALRACAKRRGAKAQARCRAHARKKYAAKASSRRSGQTGSATTKSVAIQGTRAGRGR